MDDINDFSNISNTNKELSINNKVNEFNKINNKNINKEDIKIISENNDLHVISILLQGGKLHH